MNCFIVRSAVLIVLFSAFYNVQVFSFDEVPKEPIYYNFDLENKPAPKRMTSSVSADFPLPIENEFIAKLYSFHSTNKWDCEPIENRENLLIAIAHGDYQKAIKEAEKGVKRYTPIGENFEKDVKSGALFRKYLFLLATAHELNGDWRSALSLFAILEGEHSVDFMLTEARILYSTGNREEAYNIACKVLHCLNPLPLDSVFEKIEEERKRTQGLRKISLGSASPGYYDFEWVLLWKLRDSYARIICPELHFVASHPFHETPDGAKSFDELQRESYELFLKFAEEENARLPSTSKREWETRIFHKLNEIPYGCGTTGMADMAPFQYLKRR